MWFVAVYQAKYKAGRILIGWKKTAGTLNLQTHKQDHQLNTAYTWPRDISLFR